MVMWDDDDCLFSIIQPINMVLSGIMQTQPEELRCISSRMLLSWPYFVDQLPHISVDVLTLSLLCVSTSDVAACDMDAICSMVLH